MHRRQFGPRDPYPANERRWVRAAMAGERNRALLAGAAEYERPELSRRAEPDPDWPTRLPPLAGEQKTRAGLEGRPLR